MLMKKIFTLISMALVAMGAFAQESKEELIAKGALFEAAEITMGDIKWENKNNRTDINDEAKTEFYMVMGQGNAYEQIYAEEVWTDGEPTGVYRPFYTYTEYTKGAKGIPSYGLYYKFTPEKSGELKVCIWANKGNRQTVVVKGSTGEPLVMGTDYKLSGYINGQKIKEADGETNAKNAEGQEMMRLFNNDEIMAIHNNDFTNPWADTEKYTDADRKKWDYVIAGGNQGFWGWITLNAEYGETYYIFQLSSQLGFGGYEFNVGSATPDNYKAAYKDGETIKLADEFMAVVDPTTFVANNVGTTGKSIVNIETGHMKVEAVGSATPTDVTPGAKIEATGINNAKTVEVEKDAPIFNIAGQRVAATSKGIVILNGKKVVKK